MRLSSSWSLLAALACSVLAPRAATAQCSPAWPGLCDLPVRSQIEQPNLERAVDVVLLGDGFTNLEQWHAVADAHLRAIRVEQAAGLVYAAVPAVYNFHVVDVLSETEDVADDDPSDTALGMRAVAGEGITADAFRAALAATSAPDVDVLYLVANADAGRANATLPSSLASGGVARMPRSAAAANHELGHAVARLADEYVEEVNCRPGSEASVFHLRNITGDPACHRFSNVDGAGCVTGALYCRDGWHRAAATCLMRTDGRTAPCPVCARAIERVLLQRRTLTDLAEPWAVFERPAPGEVLRGFATLQLWVWDDFFVPSTVLLEIDGVLEGQVEVAGFGVEGRLDTRALPNGPHTLTPIAVDAVGHARRGQQVTFEVANGTPGDPPSVEVTSPTAGAEVQGPAVRLAAVALDGAGQPSVEVELLTLEVDGEVVGAAPGPALEVDWDLTGVPLGEHSVSATARDRAQNEVRSVEVPITVVPPADPGLPELQVVGPPPWTAVGPFFLLRYRLGNAPPGGSAELWVDGLETDTELPLPVDPDEVVTVAVDARLWLPGLHQLRGRLHLGGLTLESPPLPVVRVDPEAPTVELVPPAPFVAGRVALVALVAGPLPVEAVSLRVEGVGPVAHAGGRGPVTLTWDTVATPDGCYRAWVEIRDSGGARGVSPVREVCVKNGAPAPLVLDPADGAVLPVGPAAVRVQLPSELPRPVPHLLVLFEPDDQGRIRRLARLDDVVGEGVFAVHLQSGIHRLQVQATDPLGGVGVSEPVTVHADACGEDIHCDDADPCTADRCAPTGICEHVPEDGCCDEATDCEDADPCTDTGCVEGRCVVERREGCCNHPGECPDDGDPCTRATCPEPGGACGVLEGLCCAADGDCVDDDPCTVDRCLAPHGLCTHDRDPGCCETSADCDDEDPCTVELCQDGQCLRGAPRAGCCRADVECEDGDPCTEDACVGNACRRQRAPGCCSEDADCDSLDPCAIPRCDPESGTCAPDQQDGCCRFDVECDDGERCTRDLCRDNACEHREACCRSVDDCDDDDPCTAELCLDGVCAFRPVAGCCIADRQCDDFDPCTTDLCEGHACASRPIPGCCVADAGCDDGDPCTADRCVGQRCAFERIPACGEPDAFVGAPPDAAPPGPDVSVDAAPDAAPDPPVDAGDVSAPDMPRDSAPDLAADQAVVTPDLAVADAPRPDGPVPDAPLVDASVEGDVSRVQRDSEPPDARAEEPEDPDEGCRCATGEGGEPPWLLALLVLARPRRRRAA